MPGNMKMMPPMMKKGGKVKKPMTYKKGGKVCK